MTTVSNDVFANHTPITLGILRNGKPEDVQRSVRDSSIAEKHFFAGVRSTNKLTGNPTTRNPPCPVGVILEAQIRSAFCQLVHGGVESAKSAAKISGATIVDATVRDDIANLPATRLEAIALGAVHTALVCSYALCDTDLRGAETHAAYFTLKAPTACVDDAAYNKAIASSTGGWKIDAVAAGDITDKGAKMAALTSDEVELAFALLVIGQASPVRAGVQLFEDGHHYHSSSNRRHSAIEDEVFNGVSAGAKQIWSGNLMLMRNAVWHAAIHPVAVGVLQALACDPEMPARLNATGFGTFALGLPAMEGEFKRAEAYFALHGKVSTIASAHGHTVSLEKLRETYVALVDIGRNGTFPALRPALPGLPSAPWPTGCDSRAKAIQLYMEPALEAAEPVVAWMFGYYSEICERSSIRRSSAAGSLLRSFALMRANGNHLGEGASAREMYATRARHIRNAATEGRLETYTGEA